MKARSIPAAAGSRRVHAADIELLAGVDEAHETLSGPATQKILHREFYDFGDRRYRRLAAISVAHIYNLRKSRGVPRATNGLPEDRATAGELSASGGGRNRKAGRDTCGWTRCIRETGMASRGCITSTRWMK